MPLIYLEASGRMGNHLFQYWVVRWLSDQLGGWPIIYWCRDYGNYMPRCIPGITYTEDASAVLAARTSPDVDRYTEEGLISWSRNLPAITERHMASQRPIYLSAYMEDYDIIRGYEEYIRRIYHIPHVQKRNSMAVHIRLGDIADKNGPAIPAYTAYILSCALQYRLPIEIYTDDPGNPLVHGMIDAVYRGTGQPVVISRTQAHDPSMDLVLMAGASVIVMMNSTFSWWAAFLGQNTPRVHVALSDRLGNGMRCTGLFIKDTTNPWELYDLDAGAVLRPLGYKDCNNKIN